MDLEAVADQITQRLVHAGDDRHHLPTDLVTNRHHLAGQGPGGIQVRHERSIAAFDIKDDGVSTGGNFLAHDRSGNQRDRFDRAGDIPEGIEFLVGWCQVIGLGQDHGPDGLSLGDGFIRGQSGHKPGNRFQFVNRAPCEAQTAAGHFDHRDTTSSNQRQDDEGCGIRDTARAVLVDFETGNAGQVELAAGTGHRQGQIAGFAVIEPFEEHRHQHG